MGCLCMYVSMYLCISISMDVCIYAWMHVLTYAYIYKCNYASMHLCIYVSMYLCISSSKERQERHDQHRPKHQAKQTNNYIETCLKIIQNCPQNHPKIDQHWSKNRSKFVQKSTKIGPKVLLESSGGHLGPKSKKSAFDPPSSPPSWEPSWSPKLVKIGPKSDPKCDHFFYSFWDRFLERLVGKLGPTWEPKPTQNSPKLGPKSNQNPFKILACF